MDTAKTPMDKNNIHFILCDIRYPGNIGSASRALKNFGFKNMTLVKPKQKGFLDAIRMAGRATDWIEKSTVVDSLSEALAEMTHIVGFSRRARELRKPVISPGELKALIESQWQGQKTALVFGSEKFGLTNSQLEHCEKIITIPASKEYSSLNITHAIAITCYEITKESHLVGVKKRENEIVPFEERSLFYKRLQDVLVRTGFFKDRDSDKCMVSVKDIFERSGIDKRDYKTLMGILKAVEKASGNK